MQGHARFISSTIAPTWQPGGRNLPGKVVVGRRPILQATVLLRFHVAISSVHKAFLKPVDGTLERTPNLMALLKPAGSVTKVSPRFSRALD